MSRTRDIARFMKKVRQGADGECWQWLAAHTAPRVPTATVLPYGQFWFEGKTQSAHRVSFKFFCGDIPRGMHVMHTCDSPTCVNPKHLTVGYPDENMADKIRKGRHWKKGT